MDLGTILSTLILGFVGAFAVVYAGPACLAIIEELLDALLNGWDTTEP